MTDGRTATMDTGELRQLIDESIKKGMEDIPNTDQVAQMIDNRLSGEIVRWGSEVDSKINSAINDTLTNLADDIRKLTTQVALLVEQNRHTTEIVRNMKKDMQRLDKEHDDIKEGQADAKTERLQIQSEIKGVVEDIWGTPDRQGVGSFVDTFNGAIKAISEQVGMSQREIIKQIKPINERTETIETKVDTIKGAVDQNTAFREARQKIEQMAVKYIGGAFKGAGNLAKNKLFWAMLLSGGGIGSLISFLVWLLENAQ